jgi:hypothetical protein
MSLFDYKYRSADGSVKSSRITAKNEKDARERLTNDGKTIVSLSLVAGEAGENKSVSSPAPAKPASNTKLGRMLYLQSGRCFFCKKELKETDASIEHLHPTSKGGKRTDDNEVVCCKALNQTFGNMELKRKFEFVLQSAGNFKCPMP